ncbi:MAG: hypothetical protein QOF33_4380 [Thermomicrobiales bacterium]|jgi:hypothetical protein|nr:hypothetical protein [Thermomicrobiales bacterium]
MDDRYSLHRLSRRSLTLGAAGLAASFALHPDRSSAAAPSVEIVPPPVSDPASYDAYVPAACKAGQFFHYTCEFDAAWAVLKTYGIETTFEEQLNAIKIDRRLEPYYQETANGVVIYGGDITRAFSGDYTGNFLARTTGAGMRHVYKRFGLRVTHVHTRERIEQNLQQGRLIWIKTTVDFKDWVPASWITPEGEQLEVAFSNDHAAIVMGYDQWGVVIRDVLGPTDTNWERPYEYEVDWDTFLRCWGAQGSDGLAVGPHDPA